MPVNTRNIFMFLLSITIPATSLVIITGLATAPYTVSADGRKHVDTQTLSEDFSSSILYSVKHFDIYNDKTNATIQSHCSKQESPVQLLGASFLS